MSIKNDDLLNDLCRRLDPGILFNDQDAMMPFTRDWRGMFTGMPLAIAQPRNTTDVSAIMRFCFENNIGVVPAGGLTGLAGGATPDDSGRQLVLSLRNMNRIRCLDVLSQTMTLEAGCILADAQSAAAAEGLLLPISLASEGSLQIGGAIATNAGGSNVMRYGMTRNRVLGLEVVLSNGVIVDGLRALQKDNAGFDWKHWFVGSEGALGVITGAVLQLVPATPFSQTILAGYDTLDDVVTSLHCMRIRVGDCLTAFEVMQRDAIERSAKLLGVASPLPDHPWLVLMEAKATFSGVEQVMMQSCEHEMKSGKIRDAIVAVSENQRSSLWRLRESITEAERRLGHSLKHDVSIAVSTIPSFVAEVLNTASSKWPEVIWNIFGHVGDGNLHVNAISSCMEDFANLSTYVHDTVHKFRGSISAEHGIGQYRLDDFNRLASIAEVGLMKNMKSMLDPKKILNPGKVL